MDSSYVIGIVAGLVGIASVAGGWIWKLSSKLKELETKNPNGSKSVLDEILRVSLSNQADIKKTLEKIENIEDVVKELSKWQIPSMERVIEALSKAIEKLITALDKTLDSLKQSQKQ